MLGCLLLSGQGKTQTADYCFHHANEYTVYDNNSPFVF